jgi:hypothetical protein
MKTLLSFLILIGLSAPSQARPATWWTPEHLSDMAEIICIATAKESTPTKFAKDIQLNGQSPLIPLRLHSTIFKILYTLKGGLTEDFQFVHHDKDYKDPRTEKVFVNGPNRISIEAGATYLLYMKKQKNGDYIWVLDGDFDDAAAVVKILGKEK